jgi:hypothetical protein
MGVTVSQSYPLSLRSPFLGELGKNGDAGVARALMTCLTLDVSSVPDSSQLDKRTVISSVRESIQTTQQP